MTSIRWRACLLSGFVTFNTGIADAQETPVWTEVVEGITDMRGIGPVQYTVGYSNVGYDHFRSEISVEWHDGGGRTQTIFDGIYDNPPAKVWGADDRLCVSMEACARGKDACTTHVIAYRYDGAVKSFGEIDDSEEWCRR